MKQAKLILDSAYAISPIDPRIYGSFVEQLGRAVYTGLYEPTHPTADANGFRRDVIRLVQQLHVPVVRYPGGNFVSGFRWEDSIGPRESRPTRLDLAWNSTETNEFGLHEFCEWAKIAQTDVMYAVNLGTGTPDDARNIVEYANHKGGTYYSDLRIRNGAPDPLNIHLWCLGNEMDGAWQMGAKTATEYGRIACEAAKMMKWTDSSIELVACGSSSSGMPTFGSWEWTVLDETYEHVDYLSLHRYYGNPHNDTSDFLASTMDLNGFIQTVAAISRGIRGKKRSRHTVHLSLDEWNVWYHSHGQDALLHRDHPWGQALPLIEDVYNFEDALLVGLMLITILKNADTVKVACLAQLVNVIAPIMTSPGGGAWAQTIYYPFMQASLYGRGTSLLPQITCDRFDTRHYSDVPVVDAAAVLSDDQAITVFAVNRDLTEPTALTCDFRALEGYTLVSHSVLHHDDMKAVNTEADPFRVVPRDVKPEMIDGQVILPPASWNVLRLARTQQK